MTSMVGVTREELRIEKTNSDFADVGLCFCYESFKFDAGRHFKILLYEFEFAVRTVEGHRKMSSRCEHWPFFKAKPDGWYHASLLINI